MDIRVIIKLDKMINHSISGSPKELAQNIGLSERSLFNYLKFMREELNAPIEYSKLRNTYRYISPSKFRFYWKK